MLTEIKFLFLKLTLEVGSVVGLRVGREVGELVTLEIGTSLGLDDGHCLYSLLPFQNPHATGQLSPTVEAVSQTSSAKQYLLFRFSVALLFLVSQEHDVVISSPFDIIRLNTSSPSLSVTSQ